MPLSENLQVKNKTFFVFSVFVLIKFIWAGKKWTEMAGKKRSR